MYDVHLEVDMDFDFEELDSDTEDLVEESNIMPYEPKKEKRFKKMKMTTGLFPRKTKWYSYTRVTEP